jgi:outer membrane immunogenic protein
MKGIWRSSVAAVLVMASSGAFAADMPVKAPPPMLPLPVYNWTGFYIGGNLGGAWTSGTLTDNFTGASLTGNNSGFIGGGQIGYNWQVSPQFVLGVEWMFDGTSISNSGRQVTVAVPTDLVFPTHVLQGSAHTNWVSTLAARFGYAANNWLFYGKAGGGWAENSATVTDLTTGLSVSGSKTNSGWLVGAGIEYGLTPNWTWKFEYDYLGLSNWNNNASTLFPVLFPGDRLTWKREINMFTTGVNYKF